MEKKKVYAVAEGEYSDYHIECIFSTKEKANEFVQCHGTNYYIEEYELDQEVVKEEKLWCVSFCIDNDKDADCVPSSYVEMRDKCKIDDYYCRDSDTICFYVDADTMDRAIKIARERYVAVKSNDYIWLRLTRPIVSTTGYGRMCHEVFNIKTNEFTKE